MKAKLLRVLIAVFSVAAIGFLAISPGRAQGSGGGGAGCCGGSGDQSTGNSNSGAVNMICGRGTHQAGNQCVRD